MEFDFNKIAPEKKKKNQILSQVNNSMNFLLHYVFCNGFIVSVGA
jgi:hypothetical protein